MHTGKQHYSYMTKRIFSVTKIVTFYIIVIVSQPLMAQDTSSTHWIITMNNNIEVRCKNLEKVANDSVQLLSKTKEGKSFLWIPMDSIKEVEKVIRHRSVGRGIWIGAAIGGITGGLLGNRIGDSPSDIYNSGTIEGTLVGLFVGAAVGSLTGVFIILAQRKPRHYFLQGLPLSEKSKLVRDLCGEN